MTNIENFNFVAYVGISPVDSLKNTANLLGAALGDVHFEKDETGYYEEYPAYCSYVLGLRLALLGIPNEDDYLGDEPLDYYELQVSTMTNGEKSMNIDLSNHIVSTLKNAQNLNAWVLD